jgi:hypothetical protein
MMPERENNSFWEIAELIEREMSVLRKMRPVGSMKDKEKEHEKRANSQS